MKINIKGPVISDGEKWIYDWFGIPAVSPGSVSRAIDQAIRNQSKEITVVINSGGGSVFAASEIYTSLKSFNGAVNVEIVGIAASAASVIAMAGTNIWMSPTAQIMIHNAATSTYGDYREMDDTSDFLQNTNKSIMNAYTLKTGKTEEELKSMMDKETWMTAQQALEQGFIDAIMFEQEKIAVASIESTLANGVLPPEVIEKVRNELLKEGKMPAGITQSFADPVNRAINSKQKEEYVMDLEELKNEHPDLYNQVRNEGFEEGIKAENQRIKEIEDLALPGNEELVNDAKFGETKKTASDLAVEMIKAQKQQGDTFLSSRKDDAKDLSEVEGSFAPQDDSSKEQEIENTVKSMAEVVNKLRGGKQ